MLPTFLQPSGNACFKTGFMLACLLFLTHCGPKDGPNPYCTDLPLPAGGVGKSGEGALQVKGTTGANFYVLLEDGKQVGYADLGKSVGLKPGRYLVKVNNLSHPVRVRKGKLTECSTGTLTAFGDTGENYYVLDSTGRQLHYEALGKAASFFPSTLRVKVNNSEVEAGVKLDQATEIKTGSLIMRGSTDENYYVNDGQGKQLAYNTLGKALALLPGQYVARVNNTETPAAINGGELTELKTGTLLVKGSTDENYYVLDGLGKQLAYQTLNKSLSFLPGNLRVRVNNSDVESSIAAEEIRTLETGGLIVNGNGSDNYYVLDLTGKQLGYNSLNKSLAFFPGEFTVKSGTQNRKTAISPGQLTTESFQSPAP